MKIFNIIILLLVFIFGLEVDGQDFDYTELSSMPESVSNNAVTGLWIEDNYYVYSFAGQDSTKLCGADHLHTYKFDYNDNSWTQLEDIPNSLPGYLAAGASVVKDKVYIIGGYHVQTTCNEISLSNVHIFDPTTDSFEADGARTLFPIDDHVQSVWNDSLIYVITGWSNNTNVNHVQIYNPSNDTWKAGTSVPNESDWKVFGASGTIIGNTIYYAGGADPICNANGCYEPTSMLRIGHIDPNDPYSITWESKVNPLSQGYRMGASSTYEYPLWIGGSQLTYNFDGIDYNGTGGVEAEYRVAYYHPTEDRIIAKFNQIPRVMDLRGVAKMSETEFIIAGGMIENQKVSNQCIKITTDGFTHVNNLQEYSITVSPNPCHDYLWFDNDMNDVTYHMFDLYGRRVNTIQNSDQSMAVDHLLPGIYFIQVIDSNHKGQITSFLKL